MAERVHGLVMATAHMAGELSGDAALVVDIDLSILGKPARIYDEFERTCGGSIGGCRGSDSRRLVAPSCDPSWRGRRSTAWRAFAIGTR
jgi:hypothetical protein